MLTLIACALGPQGPAQAQRVAAAAGATSREARAARRVDSLMKDLTRRSLFQGAVVLGSAGREWYDAGFGMADRDRRIAFAPNTRSDGGSIAKPFTAALLLGVVADGRVDWNAPVQRYLPEFPHAATRVRHLLSHAAGLPDFDWLDARVPPRTVRTNASHLAIIAREQSLPRFAPGTAFAYDNVAYDVAAMLVERVTGMSYAALVEARFARPLRLTSVLRPPRLADWPGIRTRGYRRVAGGWEANDAFDFEGFYGGSNLYVSARDLFRFMSGYRQAVGPRVAAEATRETHLDDGRRTAISPGSWYLDQRGQRRYYTGHHQGFFAVAFADDAQQFAIGWLANDTPPPWLQVGLTRALIAILEGRSPEPLAPPSPEGDVPDPTGRYRFATRGTVTVTRERSAGAELARPHVTVDGVRYEAFDIGDGTTYVPGVDAYLRFAATPNGVRMRWDSVYAVEDGVRVEPDPSPPRLPR